MLRDMLRSMFDDARRGEDRAHRQSASAAIATSKPPVLRRRTITTLCLLALAGILYGTLAPFHIDPARSWHWDLPWTAFQPGDALCNVIVYIPVGLMLRLMLRRRGSWAIVEWITSLVTAIGLSYLTEATQSILAGRVATWTDVVLNGSGAVLGIALAPAAQRMLRNHHAWLYGEMRTRPFCAMAGVAWIGLLLAALIPFDFQPTPGHLARTLAQVQSSWVAGPWHDLREFPSSSGNRAGLLPRSMRDSHGAEIVFSKLTAGSTYAALAVLLAVASIEMGRTFRGAIVYAISRSVAFVMAIELLQGLTISHQADPWDLLAGWAWCITGAVGAGALLRMYRGQLPRPMSLLSLLIATGATALLLQLGLASHSSRSDTALPSALSWLPMGASFQRSWLALMGDYASSFLRYALICSMLTLWLRSRHHSASFPVLAPVVLWFPFLGVSVAILFAHNYDTMQFVLALLAAAVLSACDRALIGPVSSATAP